MLKNSKVKKEINVKSSTWMCIYLSIVAIYVIFEAFRYGWIKL